MKKSSLAWQDQTVSEQTVVLFCTISLLVGIMLMVSQTPEGFKVVSNGVFSMQGQASVLMESIWGSR